MTILHTFPLDEPNISVIRCDGSTIYTASGLSIYDLTGGQTSHCSIGWGNEAVIAAISEQSKKYGHIDYKGFIDPNREILAQLLIEGTQFKKVYFPGNSGGDACEAAMKLSYQFHYLNNKPQKCKFISREQSYHGSTTDAMSLGDRPNLKFYSALFPNNKIKVPEHNFFKNGLKDETSEEYLDRQLSTIEKIIIENNPETISAFVGETITGGLSGFVPPVKNYWSRLKAILDKHDIHLILDEVICGTGTTGTYHAVEIDHVVPDFLFLGKTLCSGYGSLSAVLLSKKISDFLTNIDRVQHSSTHQGHSLSVAAAIEVQRISKNPEILHSVVMDSKNLFDFVRHQLRNSFFFKNIRGRGYRFAIEYDCPNPDSFGRTLTEILFKNHNILIDGKWHRITLSPMITQRYATLEPYFKKICNEFLLLESNWNEASKSSYVVSDPQKRAF